MLFQTAILGLTRSGRQFQGVVLADAGSAGKSSGAADNSRARDGELDANVSLYASGGIERDIPVLLPCRRESLRRHWSE